LFSVVISDWKSLDHPAQHLSQMWLPNERKSTDPSMRRIEKTVKLTGSVKQHQIWKMLRQNLQDSKN
jgi:hypothetical protein